MFQEGKKWLKKMLALFWTSSTIGVFITSVIACQNKKPAWAHNPSNGEQLVKLLKYNTKLVEEKKEIKLNMVKENIIDLIADETENLNAEQKLMLFDSQNFQDFTILKYKISGIKNKIWQYFQTLKKNETIDFLWNNQEYLLCFELTPNNWEKLSWTGLTESDFAKQVEVNNLKQIYTPITMQILEEIVIWINENKFINV